MLSANVVVTLDNDDWHPNATAVVVKLLHTRTHLIDVNVPGGIPGQTVRVQRDLENFRFIVHLNGELLREGAPFRKGANRPSFVARIDYEGGPPVLWKAVAFNPDIKSGDPNWFDPTPLSHWTETKQNNDRQAMIDADKDDLRRARKQFFFDLDRDTSPANMSKAQGVAMKLLRDELFDRLKDRGLKAAAPRLQGDELKRFLATFDDGRPVVRAMSTTAREALHYFSGRIRFFINNFVGRPDDTGALTASQFDNLAATFEAFANRDLEVLRSLGSPDTWAFMCFAELAIAATEESDGPFWQQLACIFCRTTIVFAVEFYRGDRREGNSYRWSPRRLGWTLPMLAKLHANWPLDAEDCCGSLDAVLENFETLLCEARLDTIRDNTGGASALLAPRDFRLERSYWTDGGS